MDTVPNRGRLPLKEGNLTGLKSGHIFIPTKSVRIIMLVNSQRGMWTSSSDRGLGEGTWGFDWPVGINGIVQVLGAKNINLSSLAIV